MALKEDFRKQLDQLARGKTRNALKRIYAAAVENAEEGVKVGDDDFETVFEMTVENSRDDATGKVRRFLDELLK